MTLGLSLIGAGLAVCFISFVMAAVNMRRGVNNVLEGTALEAPGWFAAFFRRHIGAMIGVALGTLLFWGGVLLVIATHLQGR